MAGSFEVIIEGLPELQRFEDTPDRIVEAASRAVNAATRRGRTEGAREARRQVNFPARYLTPAEGRLVVAKFATRDDLEGRVRARTRPTSLATFATSTLTPGKRGGVTVRVNPNRVSFMKAAFPIRLRRGNQEVTAENSNMGLAIRLKAGETLFNKKAFIRRGSGKSSLYLLYGPSVDQVFGSVRGDIAPELEAFLAAEFTRLVEL